MFLIDGSKKKLHKIKAVWKTEHAKIENKQVLKIVIIMLSLFLEIQMRASLLNLSQIYNHEFLHILNSKAILL